MDLVTRWFWIVLVVAVILLMVNSKGRAEQVIQALSGEVTANIKTLQGNADVAYSRGR